MLAPGAVFLMLPLVIREYMALLDNFDPLLFQSLLKLCNGGHFYSYQLGMAVWGVGGLFEKGLSFRLIAKGFAVGKQNKVSPRQLYR